MKDIKLLDDTLLDLLRMPEAQRNSEVISSALHLAASAAGLRLGQATDLQLQHMQLEGAVARLTEAMGEGFTHRTTLRLGPNLSGIELFAYIEAIGKADEIRFTGFGSTAQGVLSQLNQAIAAFGINTGQAKPKARHPNKNPLRLLPRKAREARRA
ncbi:hypothetical protein CXP40_16180 [Pseudomonas sp. YY-1]|uniref:hypothetical protein n=1 Tax=Pseudomonas sp. YY-1 TaxID=2058659 RepID=UPI000CAE5565|nr:hypothetical protein [Pseudomonas sp. YY-1]PKQ40313.1 hypothetical protein CXP40_16180 [Pseudomonas sp. YY-1]